MNEIMHLETGEITTLIDALVNHSLWVTSDEDKDPIPAVAFVSSVEPLKVIIKVPKYAAVAKFHGCLRLLSGDSPDRANMRFRIEANILPTEPSDSDLWHGRVVGICSG